MLKKYWNQFVDISFSPLGTFGWSAIGTIGMTFLTHATTALKAYAPLSYGIAAIFGIIASLIILRMAISIWIAFNQRVFTKKPTFVEFKVDNGVISITKKSNIYQEPTYQFQNHFTVQRPENAIPSTGNRTERRTKKATQPTQPVPAIKKPSSVSMIVVFDKPISPSSMLTRVEGIHGTCPTKGVSTITERWATLLLSNISDSCRFRIWFNDCEDDKQKT